MDPAPAREARTPHILTTDGSSGSRLKRDGFLLGQIIAFCSTLEFEQAKPILAQLRDGPPRALSSLTVGQEFARRYAQSMRDPTLALIARHIGQALEHGTSDLANQLCKEEFRHGTDAVLLGQGAEGKSYRKTVEGQELVVKVCSTFGAFVVQARSLAVGHDLDSFPTLVAASLKDRTLAYEYISAPSVAALPSNESPPYPQTHLNGLVHDITLLTARGARIDPKVEHFFFDMDRGFRVIDAVHRPMIAMSLGTQLWKLPDLLSERADKFDTKESKIARAVRFLDIAAKVLTALQRIDQDLFEEVQAEWRRLGNDRALTQAEGFAGELPRSGWEGCLCLDAITVLKQIFPNAGWK